jgi:nitrite reductase (NADH) small subunit
MVGGLSSERIREDFHPFDPAKRELMRITVAKIGEMADGDCRTVMGPCKAISVFRSGSDYFAIDDQCPHMGASLGGGPVEDGIVTCPWHYWRFRLSDGAWADNPRIKIGSYPVQVVGEEIQLEVPDSPDSAGPSKPTVS